MIDVTSISTDMQFGNSQVPKGVNVLSVQLRALEYLPDFGVDLSFFLDPNFEFQNSTFKAYLIQRLAESMVNVSEMNSELEQFALKYTIKVGDVNGSSKGSLIL